MSLASVSSKPSPRLLFEPLFAPSVPAAPLPVAASEPADLPIPVASHRQLLSEAESAAYERGVNDGLRETAASQLAKAREHFREALTRLEEMIAAVERRGQERESAIDDALRVLASRLCFGDDRRSLHTIFARYVTAYAAQLRTADLRAFSVSSPALRHLEDTCPEFLAALRAAGIVVQAGDGDARAVFEGVEAERAVIDFDALIEDIQTAFSGDLPTTKGGVHE